ncbi:hypothetical protein LCGC14_0683510 [marine sediment metagenome]|uniref:Uncharacterized protein n=1 Tax=marine sediment metagenome TaxID=412755 RepID=A0A0F9QMJ3_9ZZZZ
MSFDEEYEGTGKRGGWWVLAQRSNGRPIVDGPHKSEEDGDDWIINHIDDQERRNRAKVTWLPTGRTSDATRMLKHKLADSVGLDDATRNAYHPKVMEESV